MTSTAVTGRDAVAAVFDALEAAVTDALAIGFSALTGKEKIRLAARLERVLRRAPMIGYRLLAELVTDDDPRALGGKNFPDLLATALRISTADAKRRLNTAGLLGPRHALTGDELPPAYPNTAEALCRGDIGAEHVEIITRFFRNLPDHIPCDWRDQAEAHLAELAAGHGPKELARSADRLAYLANQDGPPPNDAERARRRYFKLHDQDTDGMTRVEGLLDAEARATYEALFAKLAAPGMCNPDDENPCVDGGPDEPAATRDTRTTGQRQHDALKTIGRAMLASGNLGQHNGLPATIIVTTTLQDLENAAGQGVTAGGSLLPMRDVIRLAERAYHYLAVFDEHTQEALYLGRSKRIASPAQRIMLLAKHRGCTRPGCTAPGYWSQVHHVTDWARGGTTDIDQLTLACGPDNRLATEGGWTTRVRADGRTAWYPPAHLDTGQARVNNYHHPERYLVADDLGHDRPVPDEPVREGPARDPVADDP
ncbi:hypothetical protein MHAS_01616 [Mycolicibacterium hassiacum DSM 44199]|jgi:hypothetical protein|nr:HNH endonuclease signature motif containing protein [Mycolicibacterium hassiacum]MBX5486914.1 HNH endonuclease [Mycolicibacterium hassiacum]VCT89916.1 hypothetical protein MHAS_01616 [Mycolicibacterium hassiacum DSM 44199]